MAGRLKILLIDDDREFLESLSFALSLKDFSSSCFSEPERALQTYREKDFDAVIVDYRMPRINGFDVMREIRAQNSEAKVILITGYTGEEGETGEDRTGVYAFFRKPLDIRELLKVLFLLEKEKTFKPICPQSHGDEIEADAPDN